MLLGGETKEWIPSMAAMLEELPSREAEKWCHHMRFKRDDSEAILQCLQRVPETIKASEPAGGCPPAVVDCLDPLERRGLSISLCSRRPATPREGRSYVNTWKDMATEISGNDLAEMGLRPSRAYGGDSGHGEGARGWTER